MKGIAFILVSLVSRPANVDQRAKMRIKGRNDEQSEKQAPKSKAD